MNQREKVLAAVVLVLVVALAGNYWYGKYNKALAARRAAVQQAHARLAEVSDTLARGRSAAQQMEQWQDRSLPANLEKAQSLYKAWLSAKAKDAGLAVSDIKPTPGMSNLAAYWAIGYQLEASGTIAQVAAMLYEFYRSPQLHQVTKLQLTRPAGASDLKVTLDVEALILPGATADDNLPEGDSRRLKLASPADYQKSLGERDLAAAYTPPRPPREATAERRETPPPPKFDDSEHAHFSATVGSGAGLQAWINVRTTGQTLHVVAGDPLKVGAFEGTVLSIEPLALVVESGDKRFRIALGQSLRGGTELETDAASIDARPEPGERQSQIL